MQERDALIAVIDPEERRADALGQQQADGAAEQRAEQLRDRRLAQLPFEDDRHGGQAEAQPDVDQRIGAERPQHERGIGHRADEREPDEYEPGHK